MSLSLLLGLVGTTSFIPSVEAASSSASARVIKKLKKQIRTLKAQLAAARATAPTPAPFIEIVTVGNAGNAPDQSFELRGEVRYEFQIGKFEITLAQYTAFLNAVAVSDPHGLYNESMATFPSVAGIARNGNDESYVYSVIGTGTRPVTFVSWFDAARFCNWLHHGRPTGAQTAATTERGAYTLDGATSDDQTPAGNRITRNPGAKYWIPSEDEWYKAAYHQPESEGGDDDDYWFYPTKSNDAPTAEPPPGGSNSANYSVGDGLTPVGAYAASASFYGTFDQGGNVSEWNETFDGGFRKTRGGTRNTSATTLHSSTATNTLPASEGPGIGFRVASLANP